MFSHNAKYYLFTLVFIYSLIIYPPIFCLLWRYTSAFHWRNSQTHIITIALKHATSRHQTSHVTLRTEHNISVFYPFHATCIPLSECFSGAVKLWSGGLIKIKYLHYSYILYCTVTATNQTPSAFINMLRHYEAPDIIVWILHSHNHHSLNLQLRFWLFFPSAIGWSCLIPFPVYKALMKQST